MSWINTYLCHGEEVLYTGAGITWSAKNEGAVYGEPLTAEEAQAINGVEDLSLTYPDLRKGAPPQSTVTLGPDRLKVKKPVSEGDETVGFSYTGDVHKPVTQET